MLMTLLGKRLAIAIPNTVMEEKDSLRDKTAKLGLIARACGIYGVDLIEIFRDPHGQGEAPEMRRILEYIETPQYLRKRIYPLDETLKYAGILPPLRIPSHRAKVPIDELLIGEVREGVANGNGTVEIGLERPARLKEKVTPETRVTVRVVSVKPLAAELVPREQLSEYWGYRVEVKTSAEVLSDSRFGVKVATSRFGTPIGEALGLLQNSVARADGIKLIFGSPSKGLFDIMGKGLAEQVEFVLNLYPEQHVVTVRTEEAIFAGLGLISLFSVRKA